MARSRVEEFAPLRQRLAAWARAAGVSERTLDSAILVLDELFANCVMHGYPGNPDGRIEVQAWRDGDMLLVLIRDQAPAFNPLLVPLPDTQASIEERAIGGLGLMFVRRTADSLEYRRTADGNEVIFGKRQVQ